MSAETIPLDEEQQLLHKWRNLPLEKRRAALYFVNFLDQTPTETNSLNSLEGLWAGMGFSISEQDINEARSEMWGEYTGREEK